MGSENETQHLTGEQFAAMKMPEHLDGVQASMLAMMSNVQMPDGVDRIDFSPAGLAALPDDAKAKLMEGAAWALLLTARLLHIQPDECFELLADSLDEVGVAAWQCSDGHFHAALRDPPQTHLRVVAQPPAEETKD